MAPSPALQQAAPEPLAGPMADERPRPSYGGDPVGEEEASVVERPKGSGMGVLDTAVAIAVGIVVAVVFLGVISWIAGTIWLILRVVVVGLVIVMFARFFLHHHRPQQPQ